MASNAWSFVHYACGHQLPVRGGDRHVERDCPTCEDQNAALNGKYGEVIANAAWRRTRQHVEDLSQ